jgi:hypothetical protein
LGFVIACVANIAGIEYSSEEGSEDKILIGILASLRAIIKYETWTVVVYGLFGYSVFCVLFLDFGFFLPLSPSSICALHTLQLH